MYTVHCTHTMRSAHITV